MLIKVTKHAIRRYRERVFDYSASDFEIVKMLAEIASKGTVVCSKPNSLDNCVELKYKGISIVAVKDRGFLVVITCLGESSYRKWVKSQGMPTFLSQKLRFVN